MDFEVISWQNGQVACLDFKATPRSQLWAKFGQKWIKM